MMIDLAITSRGQTVRALFEQAMTQAIRTLPKLAMTPGADEAVLGMAIDAIFDPILDLVGFMTTPEAENDD